MFIYEDNGFVGIRTTDELKQKMAIVFDTLLSFSKFKFHYKFTTITKNKTPLMMKEEVVKQAKDYSIRIERSNNKFIKPTEIYTGKSGYGYDDIIMAEQISYIVIIYFNNSAKYQKLI
jgi:hypothetical protein